MIFLLRINSYFWLLTKTYENEIPHESIYYIPDNDIPKFYLFEDLKMFGIITTMPFDIEIIGYNRFLETR